MAPATASLTPGLASFLKVVSYEPVEESIENLISLLKRRQIRGSKPCAIATAYLLRRLVSSARLTDPDRLIQRVLSVGRRLAAAQPRELAVGNIVRRVLGLIRDEDEETRGENDLSSLSSDAGTETPSARFEPTLTGLSASLNGIAGSRDPSTNTSPTRPALLASHTGLAGGRPVTSMFSILSHPTMKSSGANSPGNRSGTGTPQLGGLAASDLRAEVISGISEIIDELDQSDEQIANDAADYIHSGETIFTYSSSPTVQKFLLKAASKRKFTLIHAEAYPNNHQQTHALVTGNVDPDHDDLATLSFHKPLTAAGITVILIPDSAVFALMSRANKVILDAHAVLSNGSFVAPAGTKTVVKAAKHHHIPVIVLAGTYKLSPKYPYDPDAFVEYGDAGEVFPYQDSELRHSVQVENPIFDFVEPDCVDLFVTNVGPTATGYLYRVARDQYRDEDVDL